MLEHVQTLAMRAFLLFLSSVVVAKAHATPPNILILLTDDQGWGDVEYNCENGTAMCPLTPNIKALASADGTALFHRFYAAASVCSPTRAAVLTGRTNNRDCIDTALNCDRQAAHCPCK